VSLQRIEAIARENHLDGRHGARHLVLGLDVLDALKARTAPGRDPYEITWVGSPFAELLSVPIVVADEDFLRADMWQLRENTGRAVVEVGWLGDPACSHEHLLDITEIPDPRWHLRCIICGADWTEDRGR
jgi:hypothetical protein